MRSSKNRSRSKGNRNRSVGNIVNRVFDSSGPEGKVRGTPQQIIDKYNQLTRDAQLGNDRVAAENFQQHAEHYLRMLSEAQREMEAKREQQQQQNANNQGQGGGGSNNNNQGGGQQRNNRGGGGDQQNQQPQTQAQPEAASADGQGSFDAVIESDGKDAGLVETPESAPKPKRQRTRRRKPDAEAATPKDEAKADDGDNTPPQEAAE